MSQPIMFMGTKQHDIATIWLTCQGNEIWLHGQGKGGLITSHPYHLWESACG
jgi:hypothetical protein